jgi:PAS domain S-box-containing protein
MRSIAVYCTDISARKNAELVQKSLNDQLLAEKNRLAALTAALDSMDDPVIITNSMGNISYVNEAFKIRFGYTLMDVEEKHISTLAAPENKFGLPLEGFLSDQKLVRTGKFIARNKYGMNLPFLLKSSPIFEENRLKNRVFVLREQIVG